MQNKIEHLYHELKEKINSVMLKDISIDIINKFKNRDHEYFIQFAKLIGIDPFNDSLNRIFAKIIQIYHPDKITIIFKEIESLYKTNKFEDLLRLKNIYLIDLNSIHTALTYDYINHEKESYTEDDFGYDEYEFNSEDIFYDNEYENDIFEDKDFPYEHGFAEAVNHLFFGNIDFTLSASDLKNIDGELDLSDYEINDLTGVEHCVNTTILNLSGNDIIKIHQLSALIKLKSLFLSENSIEDISCLNSLTALQELDISFNQIEDISVLLELPLLKYVNVIHNPINNKSVIDKLLKNGVIVIF
jgi:hypothetical protein